MKLKNLSVKEVMEDPRILTALWNHFNYSIKDITSYEELTQEEKELITKPLFERITENNQPQTPLLKRTIIKREQFLAYFKVQRSGKFNMLTEEAQHATGLDNQTYGHILNNYTYLLEAFTENQVEQVSIQLPPK